MRELANIPLDLEVPEPGGQTDPLKDAQLRQEPGPIELVHAAQRPCRQRPMLLVRPMDDAKLRGRAVGDPAYQRGLRPLITRRIDHQIEAFDADLLPGRLP